MHFLFFNSTGKFAENVFRLFPYFMLICFSPCGLSSRSLCTSLCSLFLFFQADFAIYIYIVSFTFPYRLFTSPYIYIIHIYTRIHTHTHIYIYGSAGKMRSALWGEKDKNTSCLDAAEHRIAVKREIFEDSSRDVAKRAKIWSQELRATHRVIDLDADDEMPADLSLEQELGHMIDEAAGFHDGTLG